MKVRESCSFMQKQGGTADSIRPFWQKPEGIFLVLAQRMEEAL